MPRTDLYTEFLHLGNEVLRYSKCSDKAQLNAKLFCPEPWRSAINEAGK